MSARRGTSGAPSSPPRGRAPALGVLLVAVAATLPAPAAAQGARGGFTLEDVMSAPFPSGLVAAPEGDLIAWVRNERGVRNVWVAEGPTWEARPVTGYDSDDGQEIGDLLVTPDRRILYVRGGAPNRQGEIPNPESLPEPVERDLFVVSVDGGDPVKLEDVRPGVLSPAGDRLAFVDGGRIRVVGLGEGDEPETVAEPRGRPGALAWSPDGTRLAFASNRGDHGYVGVLSLEEATLTWMSPGVDRDGAPAWSPDGRRVAFLRIPSVEGRLPFAPVREAPPWSVRVADATSGRSVEVFRADPGQGSAFQGVNGPGLTWTADDRLVFPWEKGGWLRLWSVAADGGEPVLLTPGSFEVQYVALSAERERVLYDSNQDDVDRKHIWEVPADGSSAPRPLTPGEGLEWAPVETGAGTVAFLGSGPTEAARAFVLTGGRRVAPAGPLPSSFPSELVVPRQVIFPASDGMPIHGQLFLPPDAGPGDGRPAVLFFHGGSRRQMLLGFHHRGYYHNAYAFNQYLASRGYVVMSVNYRSGIGYGLEFREALDYGAAGASEFNDVVGAGLYLASRPEVDPDRIGLWGGSYGGYLTALGLARASDLFAAGVDLHGVHDWNVVIGNFVDSYDPVERAAFARTARESSPMADVDGWRSPVLLIHGDDDRNVPFSETVDLVRALRERGVEHEQLIFPDEVHGFLMHRSWLAAYGAAADFFDRHLTGGGVRAEGGS
ncbi:MAG: prolyl oligopeptidase family serine peptidase [Gemmatimonadota bacterium]|jgi:dipeptidyl aminopeptidase/acylaminoacyl peptidase